MVEPAGARHVQRGRAALRAGDLSEARAAFEAALGLKESGAALEGLGEVVHATVNHAGASRLFDRAYAAYRADDLTRDAARVARTVAYMNVLHGDLALYAGWLARARDLAQRLPTDDAERLWIDLFDAFTAPDDAVREGELRRLIDTARRMDEPDLCFDAAAILGKQLVDGGRVSDGFAFLDEALAAACGGEVSSFVIVEGVFCLMLSACESTQDVARADQWTRAADGLTAARSLATLPALCRTYHGGILVFAGRFADADEALTGAAAALDRGYQLARAGAVARLAGLRVREGRLEEAEGLLSGIEDHTDAAEPLTLLHLALGRTSLARDRAGRSASVSRGVTRARLLSMLVDAHLSEGDVAAATEVLRALESLSSDAEAGGLIVAAIAGLSRGRVLRAAGMSGAAESLRSAARLFSDAHLPLERGRAHLELARALAGADMDVAIAEARAALATFEALPAPRLADEAAGVLRSLNAPAGPGRRVAGELTKREAEVLDLLGLGLSNREIAQRLVISPKTAEHHVSRLLAKLGLRNRAEAAALAARTRPGVD